MGFIPGIQPSKQRLVSLAPCFHHYHPPLGGSFLCHFLSCWQRLCGRSHGWFLICASKEVLTLQLFFCLDHSGRSLGTHSCSLCLELKELTEPYIYTVLLMFLEFHLLNLISFHLDEKTEAPVDEDNEPKCSNDR